MVGFPFCFVFHFAGRLLESIFRHSFYSLKTQSCKTDKRKHGRNRNMLNIHVAEELFRVVCVVGDFFVSQTVYNLPILFTTFLISKGKKI